MVLIFSKMLPSPLKGRGRLRGRENKVHEEEIKRRLTGVLLHFATLKGGPTSLSANVVYDKEDLAFLSTRVLKIIIYRTK